MNTPNNRVYVPAVTVAKACGLSFLDIENRYRPDDWAAPRDFIITRAGILYAETSLGRLADALTAAGQTDAALRLREWTLSIRASWLVPEASAEGQLVALAHEEPTADILARQERSRRHYSDIEASPFRDAEL